MQPKGISQIVRVGTLSGAVLVAVSGAGLRGGNGAVEAQRKGQPPVPPTMQTGPSTLPSLDQPVLDADPVARPHGRGADEGDERRSPQEARRRCGPIAGADQ